MPSSAVNTLAILSSPLCVFLRIPGRKGCGWEESWGALLTALLMMRNFSRMPREGREGGMGWTDLRVHHSLLRAPCQARSQHPTRPGEAWKLGELQGAARLQRQWFSVGMDGLARPARGDSRPVTGPASGSPSELGLRNDMVRLVLYLPISLNSFFIRWTARRDEPVVQLCGLGVSFFREASTCCCPVEPHSMPPIHHNSSKHRAAFLAKSTNAGGYLLLCARQS